MCAFIPPADHNWMSLYCVSEDQMAVAESLCSMVTIQRQDKLITSKFE